ncbi:YD repeat-containing protein [Duganella sp. CF458]|uniref:RHS repeat domain-containing protein n=1 Tax=Duganella sp. CF458 TaxID=1884368 RepID=UPI0008E94CF1|nr:RHS repeat protein [Duganella sp. CF458]SFG28439.1 YD repeat-containing protein [Duganella sp. CF458]
MSSLKSGRFKRTQLSLAVLCLIAGNAFAFTTSTGQSYSVTKDEFRPELHRNALGLDRIDTFSGSLKMSVEDVRLRGNGGLDLVVMRNYSPVMSFRGLVDHVAYGLMGSKPHPYAEMGMAGGWSFSVAPKVNMSSNIPYGGERVEEKLCTGSDWFRYGLRVNWRPDGQAVNGSPYGPFYAPPPPDYKYSVTSYTIEHIDGQLEPLVPTAQGEARSASGWKLTCQNQMYVLNGPNGTKYELGQVSPWIPSSDGGDYSWGSLARLAQTTKIIDKNNNFARIEYADTYFPSKVVAGDGSHFLDFAYSTPSGNAYAQGPGGARHLREIKDNGGRTWQYVIQPSEEPTSPTAGNQHTNYDTYVFDLKEVVLPDGSKWEYDYWRRDFVDPGATLMKSMKFPTGGTVSYEYEYSPVVENSPWLWEYYYDYVILNEMMNSSDYWGAHKGQSARIKRRSLSSGEEWTYSYEPAKDIGQLDKTTVTTPDGIETYKHIGPWYFAGNDWQQQYANTDWSFTNRGAWKAGLLVEKTIGNAYSETNEWSSVQLSSFWPSVYTSQVLVADPHETRMPVLAKRTIVQDGATHVQTYFNFDSFGMPNSTTESGPNGSSRTTTLHYHHDTSKWLIGLPKTIAGPRNIINYTYDARGNVLTHTDDGVVTSFTYDSQGNVASKTLPRNLVHHYSNYKRGIAQNESQPEGVTIARVVDDNGNVSSETNGEGKTTSFTYDALNRIASITYPQGDPKRISYTPSSKTATRGGLVEATQYDGFGRPSSITLGGIATSMNHDHRGLKTFESNPGSSTGTSFDYDILGRTVRVLNSDGSVQSVAYGAASKAVTDERGKTTLYTYRSYGDPKELHLMSVAAHDAAANITIERNEGDMLTSLSQGGVTRGYGYNANNFLTSMTDPETGTTTFGRDAAGNMTSRKVGAAEASTFTYDGQNRLINATYPGSTPSVTNTYNKLNKLLTSTSSGGNRSYTYDANGNLTSETLAIDGHSFTAGYGYNANDQLSSITYPRSNRVVSFAPDALGRPTTVSGYVNSVSYWPSGQVRQISYANGTSSTYGQNERLWPSQFTTAKNGASTYVNSSYGYDGVGNLTAISDTVDSSFSRTLSYDDLNRLSGANGPWGNGTIAYDGAGNIKSQVLGAWSLYYNYASNRLSSISGGRATSYTYDANGNVATGSGNAYTYDGVPNLRCVNCTNASLKVEYTYDAGNNRSSVFKGGAKSYEMYGTNGLQLIEFTPSKSNSLVEYFYLGGKRVAQRASQQ